MSEPGFVCAFNSQQSASPKPNWKISWDMFTRNAGGRIEYQCRLWGLAPFVPPGEIVTAIFGSFERDGRHVLYSVYADDNGRPDGSADFQQSHMVDDISFLANQ